MQREEPKKAAKYSSGNEYRTHLVKHLRRSDHPSSEYDAPITESQKIGWEVERYQQEMWQTGKAPSPTAPRPLATAGARRVPNQQYHHKATEISHYNDCVTKHAYGRSVKSEFGAYGQARLETQAGGRGPRPLFRLLFTPPRLHSVPVHKTYVIHFFCKP